ncbi:TniQ family protein [Microvirga splendida]|uniref:TniQ family protein n=1 Tax=Microvirga splendida TaxID=2795727 RepID=A0ABS0Y7I0_9HYPH|nr:TniQ family protein [Microvirga splendida]MBJ6127865.1 TniQ family protein [Microvirga splendida]
MSAHMSLPKRLRYTVDLGLGETALSHASRTGALYGLDLGTFCADLRASAVSLAHGEEAALARLAATAGANLESLRRFALKREQPQGEAQVFSLNGQGLRPMSLCRSRVRVCLACLAEDLDSSGAPDRLRPYGRAAWMLASVRACARHGFTLTCLPAPDERPGVPDFAAVVQANWATITAGRIKGEELPASPFEAYLLARIWGDAPPVPMLDGLPWYAVARACEMMGAVSLHGPRVRRSRLSERQWREAGDEGYRIAVAGDEAFTDLLTRLHTQVRAVEDGKPRRKVGRFYEWLSSEEKDPAYAPIRDRIASHLIATTAVGPGDEIFGKPVTARRMHSVHTLSQETGEHPKRLRKLLLRQGLIDEDSRDLSDDQVVFPVGATASLALEVTGALSLKRAGHYLNAPRVQMTLLHEAGLIRPLAGKGSDLRPVFARAELDGFLARLLGDAEPVTVPMEGMATVPMEGMATIPEAAKRANCSAQEIVAAILERSLGFIGQRTGTRGYLSVLVNVEEVRAAVRRPDHGSLSLRDVERRLGVHTSAVQGLIAGGHLASEVAVNPVNRCPQTVVTEVEMTRFESETVTLSRLARERHQSREALRRMLAARGIKPAIVIEAAKRTLLFRRDAVPT